MTYTEYKNHIKLCQYLDRESVGDFKKVYDFSTNLWDGMEFTSDTCNIILHKKKEHMMTITPSWMIFIQENLLKSITSIIKPRRVVYTEKFLFNMISDHLLGQCIYDKSKSLYPVDEDWNTVKSNILKLPKFSDPIIKIENTSLIFIYTI
jgi:hypothetical protein